jgi:subtilisin family serine protease
LALTSALALPLEQLAAAPLAEVTVAVIDSGVDAAHPALAGRIAGAWSVEAAEGAMATTPAAAGANNDHYGHGTGVAGLIARTAPNARIQDIRVLDSHSGIAGEKVIEAFRFALRSDAKVINLSLACRSKYAGELNALCEQAYRKGRLVVAAKRNHPLRDLGFPAEFSSCVSVDSADAEGFLNLAWLGSPPIEFGAAGTNLRTLAPGGLYTQATGTSFATSLVSGVCCLLLGRHPDLTLFEVKAVLKHFAATPRSKPVQA